MRNAKRVRVYFLAAFVLFQTGCSVWPLNHYSAYPNQFLDGENQTNAKKHPSPQPEYFIGLALSGGGSRAANFSAAVMWELYEAGILRKVQYISSVSGGSLAAAYYALFERDSKRWNREAVRENLSQNFERWAWLYALRPDRALKFLGTAYDRTDVMAEVFQNRLFYDENGGGTKRFRDLPENPRLIINATNFTFGTSHFNFTNDQFNALHSDLASLPIGRAVATSAAFPALLRNSTLAVFERSSGEVIRYRHLFDGGPSDNLGIESLLSIYDAEISRYGKERFKNGCLLILIDAFTPFFDSDQEERPDTRRFYDVGLDISNILNSFTIFLQTKRRNVLDRLGFDEVHLGNITARDEPVGLLSEMKVDTVQPEPKETYETRKLVQDRRRSCRIWHIAATQFRPIRNQQKYNHQLLARYLPAFNQIMESRSKEYSFEEFRYDVTNIPTRFSISEKDLQNLYTAASLLVNEKETKQKVCEWLHAITGKRCK